MWNEGGGLVEGVSLRSVIVGETGRWGGAGGAGGVGMEHAVPYRVCPHPLN